MGAPDQVQIVPFVDPHRGESEHERERRAWRREREQLLALLAQQQRVAHAGLIASGLAHEVANHLMLISGRSSLAAGRDDPQRWRETLEGIPATCEEIAKTMDSVLAFSARRNEDLLESFHAAASLRQAVRLLRPLAKDRNVSLQLDADNDAVIVGRPQMLVQALVNLGSNAIRACAERAGRVRMGVACFEPGTVQLTVTDDGPGVPEELRGRMFQPFATGEADTGGHGLGLFIVRKAVRRMGGSIRVRTGPAGTSISLAIPTSA
ncbi:MAG: HAMP domain-containing sensor histidine kinase [Planctomycetota bacterium]|nr:HAMP domain-containing sensor histidine kinase [Planctomycetota bacterium]